ncbi:MAG TPA: Asp-tRNA(Asn)/Glu-tRNA(Gln) amidotransferase subunit GatC [Chlamydiales bacterium]|nr:Asp-tRNA(Asn)/Glu-tRNA(Gln) amidotransferase subunit GatC [Chlamydiales bacterium]
MANFDHQTLEHLKKLCRIECSAEENADILASLSRILEYVAQLDEVNTDETSICRYVLRDMLRNQMREDEVKDLLSRDKFLANAPDQIGGMIRVPPVLKPSS